MSHKSPPQCSHGHFNCKRKHGAPPRVSYGMGKKAYDKSVPIPVSDDTARGAAQGSRTISDMYARFRAMEK